MTAGGVIPDEENRNRPSKERLAEFDRLMATGGPEAVMRQLEKEAHMDCYQYGKS